MERGGRERERERARARERGGREGGGGGCTQERKPRARARAKITRRNRHASWHARRSEASKTRRHSRRAKPPLRRLPAEICSGPGEALPPGPSRADGDTGPNGLAAAAPAAARRACYPSRSSLRSPATRRFPLPARPLPTAARNRRPGDAGVGGRRTCPS